MQAAAVVVPLVELLPLGLEEQAVAAMDQRQQMDQMELQILEVVEVVAAHLH
jgi:hypothetical protein